MTFSLWPSCCLTIWFPFLVLPCHVSLLQGSWMKSLLTYNWSHVLQIFFPSREVHIWPDVRSLFLTIFLIVAPVTVFCVFIAWKLMDHFSHHLGISIMVVAVAFTIYVSIICVVVDKCSFLEALLSPFIFLVHSESLTLSIHIYGC